MFLRTIDYYKWHGLWYTDSNMQKWYDDSSLQKCRPQGLWFQRPWSPNFKIGCSGEKNKARTRNRNAIVFWTRESLMWGLNFVAVNVHRFYWIQVLGNQNFMILVDKQCLNTGKSYLRGEWYRLVGASIICFCLFN